MFDGLLKSKFYCKCKACAKMVKTRVEFIKRKRNAMQKYLRNDVADLLKNGLDIKAYGRAEGLVVELNRTECYEYIEQCAVQVMDNLRVLNKQKECPEDCNEAVASLMFAAARFADLPELRELRTIFSERYGSSLDFYVNKQFAEKLKSGRPSKDKKLQLLQDIAQESGLEWDSKALENKLYNEATRKEDIVKEKNDPEYKLPVNGSVHEKDSMCTEYQFKNPRESDAPERRHSHYEEKEYKLPKGPSQVFPLRDIQIDTTKKTEKQNHPNEEAQEDKPLKFQSVPPPYTKSEANKAKSSFRDNMNDSCEKMVEHTEKTKPVPKSVRRRNPGPPQFQENAGSSNGEEIEKITDKNKEKAAQSQGILKFFDGSGSNQRDEEEVMMDKLLRHYSRKKGPHNENVKPDSLVKEPIIRSRSKEGPNRSSSLPGELTSPTDTPKGHTRAASFQPEMLNGNNVHVHPKLPDYDDFLARLESLRRKS